MTTYYTAIHGGYSPLGLEERLEDIKNGIGEDAGLQPKFYITDDYDEAKKYTKNGAVIFIVKGLKPVETYHASGEVYWRKGITFAYAKKVVSESLRNMLDEAFAKKTSGAGRKRVKPMVTRAERKASKERDKENCC